MSRGINQVVHDALGDLMAETGRYGGAGEHDGTGTPTGEFMKFAWATGIECSYPTIPDGRGGAGPWESASGDPFRNGFRRAMR